MLRVKGETFHGHAVAAAPGTHAAVAQAVAGIADPPRSILDFGCYTGAMIERLTLNGFSDVSGTDLHPHFPGGGRFPFVQCDLNQPFADRFDRQFDCLTVSEVIEHLDDPRAFLRECWRLLTPGGHVILSTPNIAFFEGRIKFMLTGELWGFGAKNYLGQRHISPISIEQFPILLAECGFAIRSITTAGSFATRLRKLLTLPLWAPMRLAFGSSTLGESLIVVAQRAEAGSEAMSSHALWAAESPTATDAASEPVPIP